MWIKIQIHAIILKYFPIVFGLIVSCSSDEELQNGIPETSVRVTNHINGAIDIMEANSINRKRIDWDDFRDQVRLSALGAQNIDDADHALGLALKLLGDNHSLIRKKSGKVISGSSLFCPQSVLSPVSVPDNIGYVRIGGFSGAEPEKMIAFASGIQGEIRAQDHQNITGWIVDLRNNTGGNMWPMLAGVGPILGEGIAGFFVDPDTLYQSWTYSNGSAIIDDFTIVTVPGAYQLINPNPRVAVLLNQAVSSSGEAIAIAFIGRNNTQSFGDSTCGLSTANSGFTLSDGSILVLTTSYMTDRDKTVFGASIKPDISTTNETIIQSAIDYINN